MKIGILFHLGNREKKETWLNWLLGKISIL